MRATDWRARHGRSIVVAALLLVGAGVFGALRLPVTLFPQIDFPRIAVTVERAGARS